MILVQDFIKKGRQSKQLYNLAMAVPNKVVQRTYRRTYCKTL